MPPRTPRASRDKTGLADSPRQDTQRPEHGDHADAGGQESTNRRAARTQIPDAAPPPDAPTAPGERHRDPPLPTAGRQAQRPGQDGRMEDRIGARDVETFRSADPPGFGDDAVRSPAIPDDEGTRADSTAARRSSRSSASPRRDRGVGAEEPAPRGRRR